MADQVERTGKCYFKLKTDADSIRCLEDGGEGTQFSSKTYCDKYGSNHQFGPTASGAAQNVLKLVDCESYNWRTVLEQRQWTQTDPGEGLTDVGNLTQAVPVTTLLLDPPVRATQLLVVGRKNDAKYSGKAFDYFRFTEVAVKGLRVERPYLKDYTELTQLDVAADRGTTCVMDRGDPLFHYRTENDHSGVDCKTTLLDGDATWSKYSGRHVHPNGNVVVSFPSAVPFTTVTIMQDPAGPRAGFELWVLGEDDKWQRVATQTDFTSSAGFEQVFTTTQAYTKQASLLERTPADPCRREPHRPAGVPCPSMRAAARPAVGSLLPCTDPLCSALGRPSTRR